MYLALDEKIRHKTFLFLSDLLTTSSTTRIIACLRRLRTKILTKDFTKYCAYISKSMLVVLLWLNAAWCKNSNNRLRLPSVKVKQKPKCFLAHSVHNDDTVKSRLDHTTGRAAVAEPSLGVSRTSASFIQQDGNGGFVEHIVADATEKRFA